MSSTTDLTTFKINLLTQAQYDTAVNNNEIDPNELYLTPAQGSGVSDVEVDGVSVVSGGVASVDLSGKQDTLVSGTNIKTINNNSLLGSGNITISGGGGTNDYDQLNNRPQINSTTLTGNKSSSDLGLADASHSHTKSDITDFPTINDVYWATYNTTTSAQLESAYQGGKLVCVFYSSKLYTLRYRNSSTDHRFVANYGTSQYQIACSNNTWSSETYTFAQTSQLPSAATATPSMDGTAAVGSSSKYAKEDHVHPTDTSRAASSHTHTKSEITDFPTIPTVNDATLTIQKNGTNVTTFTANASSNATANITVPTNTSDLNNDSGFLTSETDPVFSASAASGISSSDITSWNGKSTVSLNRKTTSGTNIADLTIDGTTTKLYAPTSGGGSSDYDDLSNRPQINSTTLTGNKTLTDLGMKTEILNLFYPVGSYYETSDTSFDPNNSWGGTWVLETEGQVHVSGSASGTYQISGAPTDTNDGGSKDAIVVSHDHSVSITSGAGGQHRHSVSITSGAGTAHKHGTGNSTSTDFLRTQSDATIGRRTIKRGTGDSTENNLYSTEIVGHVTGTANESSHTHSVSGNTGYENVHTHSVSGSTGSQGSSGTGANMQPYIIVNRWHRTA